AESITAWVVSIGQEKRGKCAIYRYPDYKLIGVTEEKLVPIIDGWVMFNFVEKPSLIGGIRYVLVAWMEWVGGTFTEIRFNDVPEVIGLSQSIIYDSFPDPFAPTREAAEAHSIFCTYTPGVPPPTHTLTVESTPIAVPVTLNGSAIGNTPISATVEEGSHTVEIPAEVSA
ncbi:unnamed protein product, partial [marine sediment metagenome]